MMAKSRKEISLILDENALPIVKQIAEGMPGGFFIYHADGGEELIYINSAMLRIFGCDTEEEFRELTGNSFRGIVHPEDLDEVEKSIARQIEHSIYDLDYVEYRIIQKNGNVCWVEDYGHYLQTREYGNIFCVFIEDATERLRDRMGELERINRELQASYVKELQYRKAILYDAAFFFEANLTQDTFMTNRVEEPGGKIYAPNETMTTGTFRKYSEYVAYREKSIDRDRLEEYRHFFDMQRLVRCYDNQELEQTFECWGTDGHGRKHLYHYVVLLGIKEPAGDIVALVMAKDITEQAEKQSLLKIALSQAETAKVTRDAFLSNMSHDIRTPLNAIIGYTELVRNHLTESGKVENYVQKIKMSGEQLLKILNESLEVSRIESGRINLTEADCILTDLVSSVEETVRSEIDAKDIHFSVDCSKVMHFAVIVDFIRLQEILCQLLDNAVKYTNSGGNVRLVISEKDIDLRGYGKYQFTVEDDGIGISPEFLEHIFTPFKRENNTTQSGVIGSGLGLTLVKSLVDMMEGRISVESEPSKGSRFTVSLLLKLQQNQTKGLSGAGSPIDKDFFKGSRILLAEDNDINSEIAEGLLKAMGYEVETAENGQVALEKIKNSSPHYYALVLMDIQMPVMDGYEATRAIRGLADRQLANVPIIALSANAFAEDYYKSIEAGMDAHFSKPIEVESLQELICSVLSTRL